MTWILGVGVAVITAFWWQIGMAMASEPVTDEPKILYRDLRSPTLTAIAALLGGAVMTCAVHATARPAWPVWAVVAVDGSVLALVDACTTWMPKRLAHLGWALMGVAAGSSMLIEHGHHVVMGALGGGIGSALLFVGLWVVTRRGFGFGDVRFMPLLGAATGATSLHCWSAGLLCGAVLLGVHAVVDRMIVRRVRIFPWGPAFMAGGVIALFVG